MKAGCLVWIIVLLVNLIVGAWSVGEILSWFDKDIPTVFDALIGLVAGEVAIPVAIVGWILHSFGVFTVPIV
jgi:hypothetical protein